MAFSDKFPLDMMGSWVPAAWAASSLYSMCKGALELASRTDQVAYVKMFGSSGAVRAAGELHALRYGSPDDARRAMEYGADPVASVVACLLDVTPLGATVPPRLIDRAAIETIEELAPIVRSVRALFYTPGAVGARAATLADVAKTV